MKNILGVLILFISNIFWAQNTFDISSETIDVDTNFSLAVGLDNSSAVTAFQFDIDYNGDAIELSTGHSLTSRADNHSLTASSVDDSTIRVIVYSASNALIDVGTGTVLNLNFTSQNLPGTYNLTISDIVLSDASGAQLTSDATSGSVTVVGPMYNLNTTSVEFGDVPMGNSPTQNVSISNNGNSDLVVSSYSLNSPFSISNTFPVTISSGSSTSFTINIDSSTKQDVTKTLTFTTSDTDPLRAVQSSSIHANVFAVNEIHVGSGQGEANTEITIPVSINNMEPFSGFQFDITLPNDVSYVENSLEFTSRASDHSIAANVINGNVLRFVAYSGTNAEFSGDQGEVFSFKLIPNVSSGIYALNISNSIISNVSLGDIVSDVYNGSFTINAPSLSTNVQTIDYGRIPITEVQTTQINLQNSGSATLIIDEVIKNDNIFTMPLDLPLTIDIGQSESTTLTFTPNVIGLYDEDISIRHNGPADQNIINVLADVFSPNYLRIVDKLVQRELTSQISLNLVNNDIIRAIQFDINFPSGFDLDLDNIISTSVLDDFTVSTSSIGNNNYRFVIYTVSNSNINSSDQTILNLPVYVQSSVAFGDYEFEISDVVLSSESNQNIASEALLVGTITVAEDLTAPVITLTGDNPMTIEVGSTFVDPGASATDDFDGNVTVTTSGTVDSNTVGTYTLTYTATDSSGNTATTTRTVNVVDTTAPTVICENISIELSSSGSVSISADDIDNGSSDYSGISDLSISTSSFDCSNLGDNDVVLTVTDIYGNSAQCTAVITVTDAMDPIVICNDITITLENMLAEIVIDDIDNGSSDNCGISNMEISQTQFTDEHIGDNVVTLTVTDNNGNTSTCDALVTVDAGLGIDDNILANISLYPNPSSDLVFIKGANTELEAVVFDLLGKQVMREFITDKLDISCLEKGTYIINLTDGINTSSHKIIKN
jgi:hypothetical protein